MQDLEKNGTVRRFRKHGWSRSEINVVIPGSCGIPKWVSHQSTGHEVRIVLPENGYEDKNFLGFALFFYLVPLDVDDPICANMYSPLDNNDIQFVISDDQFQLTKTINIRMHWQSIIDSDYECISFSTLSTSFLDPALAVVYFPQISIAREYRSNRWNKITVRFEGPFGARDCLAFNVESCGIDLIYHERNHQLFNLKRSHHDAEDHPQHKKSRQV